MPFRPAMPFVIRPRVYSNAAHSYLSSVQFDGGFVTDARKVIVDDLIVHLGTVGLWEKIDRLWIFASENSQSALRDIVSASAAAVVSAPTFTADRGYTGNGTTSYVNSQYTPSTNGVKYTQDSAHICAWSLTAGAGGSNSNRAIGNIVGGTNRSVLIPRNASDQVQILMNGITSDVAVNTSTDGFFIVNRSASGATQVYRNGSSILSGTSTSTGLPTQAITADQDAATNLGTLQIAALGAGGSLSATDAVNYYDAMQPFLRAVGAV